MFKKILLALALVTGTLAIPTGPARAIVLPPPGGNTLFVTAYYSDSNKTTLVGQKWSGCGQPSGQWGATTSFFNVFFPAC